jgi:leucine dehydrogenase
MMVMMLQDNMSPAQVHMVRDEAAGLDGLIVLHSTVLGPGAGGCRFWTYAGPGDMAIDAFRLAEGMTYKNALAGLPLGGGKAVLRRPSGSFDRDRLFQAFGEAVQSLRGEYLTAEDVGTSVGDMQQVARKTRYVAGLPSTTERPSGDPSPWTARGTFVSMEVAARRRLGKSLSDCTVAVQGVGHVGAELVALLSAAGARVVVADVNREIVEEVVKRTGANACSVDDILSADVDVLAPCALGGVFSDKTIGSIRAKVVCGAANNQLATIADGSRLADRDILYAPDYVVNAGGIINVAAEYLGWSLAKVEDLVTHAGDRLSRVLDLAASASLPTNVAADQLARAVIADRAAETTAKAA